MYRGEMLRYELLAAPQRRREMEHGVMGDPRVASAEKGERLFGVLLERLIAL